ncbi:MAG: cyclic nucleotide-binding domain-containing protein [bacterium]
MSVSCSAFASGEMDVAWAPSHATVGIVATDEEATQVFQLRYRVFVHELGRRGEGVDRARGELTGQLDASSRLWQARDGQALVGTITQTMIGPDFDLSLVPPELELNRFRSVAGLIGYSSRFAIDPTHRSLWVLPSLARHTYAHGRRLGAKFDFMATNPGLVPLFERMGYVRYTASSISSKAVGLLIPMVLPATDLAHLRRVRSACLPAAEHFASEPEWGEWLRATHPMIGHYYERDRRSKRVAALLQERVGLSANLADEVCELGYVHRFPAGTSLLREEDRVTCAFVAMEGELSVRRRRGRGAETLPRRAADGVAYARGAMRCETDAEVLCVPVTAIARLQRRHPAHAARLQELVSACD